MTLFRMTARWGLSLCLALVFLQSVARAEEVRLDHAPINLSDQASLQRGAQHFMNYCMTCHGAHLARFDLLERTGLNKEQIQKNLILTNAKIADYMSVVLNRKDAKAWFGAPPPDLSVEARVRGADWLYTYLRSFYRDDRRDSGWNNRVFPNVAMPHVLWQLQGQQILKGDALVLEQPGTLSPKEYDQYVADLVNFLVFLGEPEQQNRVRLGYGAFIFLVIFFFLARALKHEYWKDVH